jgi:hypothetical protein
MNIGLFPPVKRNGLILHAIVLLVAGSISAWGFYELSQVGIGADFAIFLLVGLIAFAPLPFFGYRGYALLRAEYVLDRDSLELRWGLRDETVPLSDIEWMRPAEDLTQQLQLPVASMPGAILGLSRHPDLGVVEFMASDRKNLVLVATAKRVFALSPAEPAEFTQTFARAVELGSIAPAEPKSVYPSFILAQAWENGLARYLWLAALFLNLGLFIWVSFSIPAYPRVSLGFEPDGSLNAVPSAQLILLPLISMLLALIGWAGGLYYYRWDERRPLALILWSSSALASLCFLIAILFIISTPV